MMLLNVKIEQKRILNKLLMHYLNFQYFQIQIFTKKIIMNLLNILILMINNMEQEKTYLVLMKKIMEICIKCSRDQSELNYQTQKLRIGDTNIMYIYWIQNGNKIL